MKRAFKPVLAGLAAIGFLSSTFAHAGEVKGPPPDGNYSGDGIDPKSRSICAYSGLNDSPDGDPSVNDPGGIVQSFGAFFASNGFDVSDLSPLEDFFSPGFACNPNRGPSQK